MTDPNDPIEPSVGDEAEAAAREIARLRARAVDADTERTRLAAEVARLTAERDALRCRAPVVITMDADDLRSEIGRMIGAAMPAEVNATVAERDALRTFAMRIAAACPVSGGEPLDLDHLAEQVASVIGRGPDADLIAHAPTDLAALLAYVRKLEAEVAWHEDRSGTRAEQEQQDAEWAADDAKMDAMSDDEIRASLEASGVRVDDAIRRSDALIRVCTERAALSAQVDRLTAELAARAPDLREISALRAALCATLSEAPCRLDHHGYCQEHGPGPIPCPVPAAWTLAVGAPLPPEPEPSALALFLAVLATDEDPGRDLGGGDCGGDR